MTRSKHTKQRARRARQTSRAAPPTPAPTAPTSTPPDATTPAATPAPTAQAVHSEGTTTDLVLADLATHAVSASLPTLLHARCAWADALPPAAARQFADQARVAVSEATPETLREDLSEVLTRWHGTARTFGSA